MESILKHFPAIDLIIAFGEKPAGAKQAQKWISPTATRGFPKKKNYPRKLKYIFERTDSRASKAVILSSYETFSNRTLRSEFEGPSSTRKAFTSNWNQIFRLMIADEGHKLRHSWTQTFHSIPCLSAEIHWFLTATPVVNKALVGLPP